MTREQSQFYARLTLALMLILFGVMIVRSLPRLNKPVPHGIWIDTGVTRAKR